MKPRKGYYKPLDNGRYACPVCGTVYNPPFGRHDATQCCADMKPITEIGIRQAEDILQQSYYIPTPRTAQPHDGTWHKDKWGHWRRGRQRKPKQTEAEYHKAQSQIHKQMDAEILAHLDSLFSNLDDDVHEWVSEFNRERSADQRISYAWNIRNYELLKSAVFQAVREAMQARTKYILLHPAEFGLKVDDSDTLDNKKDSANQEGGKNND